MEMKSAIVTTKPRLDEYINELCHKPISKERIKAYCKDRVHARLAAKSKSRKTVQRMINNTSNRLYNNSTSPVPSDLGLFKAANQRRVKNRKLNSDLVQRLEE